MSTSLAPIHDLQALACPVTSRTTWVFVSIRDAEGREGLGEATLEGRAAEVQAAILRQRQDLLGRRFGAGVDAARWASARLPADHNLIEAAAISGIEQALQDLCAGALGLRLADALGQVLRDPVPMYANINRGTTTRQPGQFAERALRAARIGFAGIKIAPFDGLTPELADSAEGRPLIDAGLARIAAVRQALDAGGFQQRSLMVDCHWRFSVRAAQAMIAELAALGVDWYECPIPEEASFHPSLLSLRSAANQRGMRLAGAELMVGTLGFMAILRAGLYDVVMPDVKYAGGLEETLRIAALAERFGTGCSPHNPSGPICHAHSLHVASVIPNMPLLEVQFEETERFVEIADARLPVFIEGASAIPSGPGLGVGLSSLSQSGGR
jgi:galactonate dehydratase